MADHVAAMTRSGIENIMRGVAESVACEDCKKAVNDHIKDISTQWMILNVRLSFYSSFTGLTLVNQITSTSQRTI